MKRAEEAKLAQEEKARRAAMLELARAWEAFQEAPFVLPELEKAQDWVSDSIAALAPLCGVLPVEIRP